MDAEGFSIVNCRSSSPSLRANPAPTPRDRSQVNLFTEEFLNAGGEEDLKDYSLNPTPHQLTKKAFFGKKTYLVTAALSTTTAISSACVSIYTNKRAALASPAKFGTKQQKGKGNHPASKKFPQRRAQARIRPDDGGTGMLEGGIQGHAESKDGPSGAIGK